MSPTGYQCGECDTLYMPTESPDEWCPECGSASFREFFGVADLEDMVKLVAYLERLRGSVRPGDPNNPKDWSP